MEFAESGSEGTSGGMLTMWNPAIFKPIAVTIHMNFVAVRGFLVDLECFMVNVWVFW